MNIDKELKDALEPLWEDVGKNQWAAIQREIARREQQATPEPAPEPPIKPVFCRKKFVRALALCAAAVVILVGVILGCLCSDTKVMVENPFVSQGEGSSIVENGVWQDVVFVNEVDATSMPSRQLLGKNEVYSKELQLNELINYLGCDVRPENFPDDLYFRDDIFEKCPPKLEYYNDGKLILKSQYNSFCIFYSSEADSTRRIALFCSKTNAPVGEKSYPLKNPNGEYKMSILNQTEVKIGHVVTEYAFEGGIFPTERYVAEFTVAGVHTQVATDNLTLEEFLTVVKSIIRE